MMLIPASKCECLELVLLWARMTPGLARTSRPDRQQQQKAHGISPCKEFLRVSLTRRKPTLLQLTKPAPEEKSAGAEV